MLYRIRLDLSFNEEDPPNDIFDKAIDHLGDAITLNPGTPQEEVGYITLERCYHDQDPNLPCEVIESHQTPP